MGKLSPKAGSNSELADPVFLRKLAAHWNRQRGDFIGDPEVQALLKEIDERMDRLQQMPTEKLWPYAHERIDWFMRVDWSTNQQEIRNRLDAVQLSAARAPGHAPDHSHWYRDKIGVFADTLLHIFGPSPDPPVNAIDQAEAQELWLLQKPIVRWMAKSLIDEDRKLFDLLASEIKSFQNPKSRDYNNKGRQTQRLLDRIEEKCKALLGLELWRQKRTAKRKSRAKIKRTR